MESRTTTDVDNIRCVITPFYRYKDVMKTRDIDYHPQNNTEHWICWVSRKKTKDNKRYQYIFYQFLFDSIVTNIVVSKTILTYINSKSPLDRCFCEIIPGSWKRLLFFDIDISPPNGITEQEIDLAMRDAISTYLHKYGYALYGYPIILTYSQTRPGKISLHIILHKFYFDNNSFAQRAFLEIRDSLLKQYHCPISFQFEQGIA